MPDPCATRDRLGVYYVEAPGRGGHYSSLYGEPAEYHVPCGVYVAGSRGEAKMMLIRDWDLDLPDDYLDARSRLLGTPNPREAVRGRVGDSSPMVGSHAEREHHREGRAMTGRPPQNMRALMIAELLRLGHQPADVAAAVKQCDEGDLDAALRILTKLEAAP